MRKQRLVHIGRGVYAPAPPRIAKPKYKVGDMVYSWQNPTVKREINRVNESTERGYPHKYRLTLIDREGNHYNSKWTNEGSLSKRRRL